MDPRSMLDVWATVRKHRAPVVTASERVAGTGQRRRAKRYESGPDWLNSPTVAGALEPMLNSLAVERAKAVLRGTVEPPAELLAIRDWREALERFVVRQGYKRAQVRLSGPVLGSVAQDLYLVCEPVVLGVGVLAECLARHPRRGPYAVQKPGGRGSDDYRAVLLELRYEVRAEFYERLFSAVGAGCLSRYPRTTSAEGVPCASQVQNGTSPGTCSGPALP